MVDFVLATQPKEWKKLAQRHGAAVREQFLKRLATEIERRGALDVMRNCIKDSGCKFRVENTNHAVDELIESGLLKRVLAMTEINFSNSLIEAWWRCPKHHWLFLNTLDSVERVRELVEFYVTEHNSKVPHSAFRGQTPDEMYSGTGAVLPDPLAAACAAARAVRLKANREARCAVCA